MKTWVLPLIFASIFAGCAKSETSSVKQNKNLESTKISNVSNVCFSLSSYVYRNKDDKETKSNFESPIYYSVNVRTSGAATPGIFGAPFRKGEVSVDRSLRSLNSNDTFLPPIFSIDGKAIESKLIARNGQLSLSASDLSDNIDLNFNFQSNSVSLRYLSVSGKEISILGTDLSSCTNSRTLDVKMLYAIRNLGRSSHGNSNMRIVTSKNPLAAGDEEKAVAFGDTSGKDMDSEFDENMVFGLQENK